MKKHIWYLPILLVLLLAGCEDLLDVKTTASLNVDDGVITTTERATLAINGMYDGLQDEEYYANYLITYGDLAADNLDHTGTFTTSRQVDNNEVLTNNVTLNTVWDQLYYVINIANTIIADVPEINNIEAATSSRMTGEAYFIRALSYFSLVKSWGDVPLQTTPVRNSTDVEQLSRSSVSDVYDQIESDLDEAITNLEGYLENGRASSWAAKALKSRVHLYQGEYQDAHDLADDVIKNGPFSLVGDYTDIFDYQNPYSPESIFEVDFTGQDGNSLAFWYYEDDFGGRYEYGVTTDLANAYEPDDERFGVIYFYPSTGNYMVNKYQDVGSGSDNVIVVRLGEMYLNRAEALFNGATGTSTALDDINTLRNRASLVDLADPLTLDIILDERRKELAFEGHRWYDLTRTDKGVEVLPNVTSTDQYLWPIPQSERDVNPNLTQNPGY